MKKYLWTITGMLVLLIALGLAPAVWTADYSHAASLQLNETTIDGHPGQTVKLKVIGARKAVKWTSTNQKVAKVSKKGKVKLKKPGRCVVRAKTNGKTLKCRVKVTKRQNSFVYKDDVIRDEVDYITDYTVKAGRNDGLQVSIPTDGYIEGILQEGEVVLLPPNGEYDGLAIRVETISYVGSNIVLSGQTPAAEEVFDEVDIQEIAYGDLDDMIVNEDIVSPEWKAKNARSNGSSEAAGKKSRSHKIGDDITLPIDESLNQFSAKGEITIGTPTITPDYKVVWKGLKPKLKRFNINVSAESKVDVTARVEDEVSLYLASIPGIQLGEGFVADVIFYIDFSGSGQASLRATLSFNAGLNYPGRGKVRTYDNSDFSVETKAEIDIKTLLEITPFIGYGGWWDPVANTRAGDIPLAGVSLRGGPGFSSSVMTHNTEPYLCQDDTVYVYVDVKLRDAMQSDESDEFWNVNVLYHLFQLLELETQWVVLDNNLDNPLRYRSHIEDGEEVERCTWEDPMYCFNTVDEIGNPYGDITTRWGIYDNGVIEDGPPQYHMYSCYYNSLEYDFLGSEFISGSNGDGEWVVNDADLCIGMHGSAKDMLGITSNMKVSTFEKATGLTMKKLTLERMPQMDLACHTLASKIMNGEDIGIFSKVELVGVNHKCLLYIEGVAKDGEITPDTRVYIEGGERINDPQEDDPTDDPVYGEDAYQPVLDEYTQMLDDIDAGRFDMDNFEQYGYKYIYDEIALRASGGPGGTEHEPFRPWYAFDDINRDGTPECIIGAEYDEGQFALGSVFTLNARGKVKTLINCESFLYRGDLYLYEDGTLMNGGSSGWVYSRWIVSKLPSGAVKLKTVHELIESDGKYTHNGEKISHKKYKRLLKKYSGKEPMPLFWMNF